MADFKQRIYQTYRSTTSQNRYRSLSGHSSGNSQLQFENRWGRFLPENQDAQILDVACGSGEFLLFLKHKGFTQTTGIDLSSEQIQAAQSAGLDNVRQVDALSFLANCPPQFAVISAFSFLEHLTRDELFKHLDAMSAALQPGGLLLALVPNAKGPFGAYVRHADITHESSFTPESILQIAAVLGLQPIYIGECGPIIHGPISFFRWSVWQMIRGLFLVARIAQAADYRYRIYTQDLYFVLCKQR